jgi:hypothetical protein
LPLAEVHRESQKWKGCEAEDSVLPHPVRSIVLSGFQAPWFGSVSEHKFQERKRFSARKKAKSPARAGKRKI